MTHHPRSIMILLALMTLTTLTVIACLAMGDDSPVWPNGMAWEGRA